jgi:hypothetical protein
MRGPQTQPGYQAAFPAGMFGQTPYLAVPTLPGQTPGSYYLAPTQLPPTGGAPSGAPVAPVGPSGFSSDWTGFPLTATVPPPGTPWQAMQGFPGQHPQAMQGFPGQHPQAPPGTGFGMFQQQLPQMGAFMHPGYMAVQTPYMGGGAVPAAAGWPSAGFPGAGMPMFAGAAAVAAAAPAAPAPASHSMPPARGVSEGFDKFDKFAEENACKFGAYLLYTLVLICCRWTCARRFSGKGRESSARAEPSPCATAR